MSLENLKNLKNILLVFIFVFIVIGFPYTSDKNGNETGIIGAIVMAILLVGLQTVLWSDWFYYNQRLNAEHAIKDKIEHKTFLKIGIGAIIIISFFPFGAIYNELFKGNINIIHLPIVIIITYFSIRKL